MRPMTMNGWMYTEGNPVNRLDPSGNCTYPVEWEKDYCWWLVKKLGISSDISLEVQVPELEAIYASRFKVPFTSVKLYYDDEVYKLARQGQGCLACHLGKEGYAVTYPTNPEIESGSARAIQAGQETITVAVELYLLYQGGKELFNLCKDVYGAVRNLTRINRVATAACADGDCTNEVAPLLNAAGGGGGGGGIPSNLSNLRGANAKQLAAALPKGWKIDYSPTPFKGGGTGPQWLVTSPDGQVQLRIKAADPAFGSDVWQLRIAVKSPTAASQFGTKAGENPKIPGEFWASFDNDLNPVHFNTNEAHIPLDRNITLEELIRVFRVGP